MTAPQVGAVADPTTLLTDPRGVWLTVGIVAAFALTAAVLPLRGGHGRHAHAGPGSLNVWQLSDTPTGYRSERTVLATGPPNRSVHPRSQRETQPPPEAEPEGIVWPPDPPESWSLDGSSPLERALAELLGLGEPDPCSAHDPDHVGRHRLVECAEVAA